MSEAQAEYGRAQLWAEAIDADRDHFTDVCAIAVLQGLLAGDQEWSAPGRVKALVVCAWDIAEAMAEERDSR